MNQPLLPKSQDHRAPTFIPTPTSVPSTCASENRALLAEIYAEIDEFYASCLQDQQVPPPPTQPGKLSLEVDPSTTPVAADVDPTDPVFSDHRSSPFTPVDLSQVDYQSLPDKPEIVLDDYDPNMAERVLIALYTYDIRHAARVSNYGKEVAETYRRGLTPSPVRRKYREKCERAEREMEMSSSEDEGGPEGATAGEAREDDSRRKMNEVRDRGHILAEKSDLLSKCAQPGDCHAIGDNLLVTNIEEVCGDRSSGKRRRGELETLEDTSEPASAEGRSKMRKTCA